MAWVASGMAVCDAGLCRALAVLGWLVGAVGGEAVDAGSWIV